MSNFAEQFYLRFPVLRDVGATLKGVQIRRERYGKVFRRELSAIEERDTWTAEQLSAYQSARLREIVQIAARHVPYYRELFSRTGLAAAQIQTPRDLPKLPVLEKSAVRADPLKFVDERIGQRDLIEETTTGTTGVPIRVLISRQALQRHYAFLEGRSRRIANFMYGRDPYVMFGARRVVSLDRNKSPFWCYNYAARQLYMSAFHLSPAYMQAYCRELKRRRYKALIGYASVMSAIARFVLDNKIRGLSVPVAITNGETLQPHQRTLIERAFGCEVFDQYGCAEMSVFAAERRCHRMHVSADYGITEILGDTGLPCPPEQPGHVVATGLVNEAQILLRCRVGDIASWRGGPCECGSAHPVFSSLDGRASNAMLLRDGRMIFRVGTIAEEIKSVREYQIVQEEIDRFVIYVVALKPLNDPDRAEIVRNFSNYVGHADIRVETVAQLERGPGAKFAFITSKLPHPESSSPVRVSSLSR